MPQVSVVIPCHQVQPYVARAVRSLLVQSFREWEAVIVSDDGEDYDAILKAQGIEDPRLRFTSTGAVAAGVNVARNAGLDAAQASFIATLDADDAYTPQRLEKMLPFAREYGMALCNVRYIDEETGEILPSFTYVEGSGPIGIHDIFRVTMNMSSRWVFDRNVVRQRWLEDLRQFTDAPFTFGAFDDIEALYYLNEPLYVYYRRKGSLSYSEDSPKRYIATKQYLLQRLEKGNYPIRNPIVRQAFRMFVEQSLEAEKEWQPKFEDGSDTHFMELFAERLRQRGYL